MRHTYIDGDEFCIKCDKSTIGGGKSHCLTIWGRTELETIHNWNLLQGED